MSSVRAEAFRRRAFTVCRIMSRKAAVRRAILQSGRVFAIAMGLIFPHTVFAACYVAPPPEGFAPLRQKPDDKAKLVARMERSSMVDEVSTVPERNGWVYVRWSKEQMSQSSFDRGKGDGKGWMKREHISGECED